MNGLPPYERPINMMFQSYALFPHMTVEQNIAFGLKQDGLAKDAIARRVGEMLELVQLGKLAKRKPHQLSGGQQQRVALARSLAKGPKLLLLDEPMGALDKKLRSQMQLELVNIIEQSGVTCVMVTHDQEEAMTMATRIAVMDQGWIQQVGKPDDIYEQPANRFVAELHRLGEPVRGRDRRGPARVRHRAHPGVPRTDLHRPRHHRLRRAAGVVRAAPGEGAYRQGASRQQATNKAQGIIEDIAYFGSHSVYHVRLPGGTKILSNFANMQRWASDGLTWNDQVWVSWDDNDGVVLTS